MVLFALVTHEIIQYSKHKIISYLFIATTFLLTLRGNIELRENFIPPLGDSQEPSFMQFFDTKLFDKIKGTEIIQSNDKFISIGLHPSILQYNGLQTLDSYQNNYRLDYKHIFEKVISEEIEKNQDLKIYFNEWGSRCYAFSASLGKNFVISKSNTQTIEAPDYNWEVLKTLGGRFVISSLEIHNLSGKPLRFVKSFESEESYWRLWLYEIIEI